MNWNWYVEVLKKYAVFEGRSAREEFWVFTLVNFIVSLVLHFIFPLLGMIYALAVLLPGIGVGIRRLHDIGRSGWWLLISFVPLIGIVVLIYFFVQDSQPGSNEYGPNPKGA
ncbi:MAG TPA: DUF805 domain-containing protein [Burkholderiales bacterium]|jgi:uncharacterized membrane protein YhaH (DUF805 family)|nr:DUF805 domain-containing protein [Burkholderiales bacterium]